MELSHKTAPNRQVFIYFDIWNPDDFFFGGGHQAMGGRQVAFATSVRAPIIRHSRKLAPPVCLIRLFFRYRLRSNKRSVAEASANLADANFANSLPPSPDDLPPIKDSFPRIPLSVYIENLTVSATPDAGCSMLPICCRKLRTSAVLSFRTGSCCDICLYYGQWPRLHFGL